jgi:hypothetical protein
MTPKVGEAHHVGDFLHAVFDAEFAGGFFGRLLEAVAAGTAGAEDLDGFHGLRSFVVGKWCDEIRIRTTRRRASRKRSP